MRNLIHTLIFLVVIFLLQNCASTPKHNSVKSSLKLTAFEDLDSLMQLDERKIAVFMHTDWCRYCKNMRSTTLSDNEIIQLLNNNYYFISFNAEQKENVVFNNTTFRYNPSGRSSGTHELALALGTIDGELAYPSFVILSPEKEIVFQHNAFISKDDMKNILSAAL